MTETRELKPFHEIIVKLLEEFGDDRFAMLFVALLSETKIPKNHDAIVAALRQAWPKFATWGPIVLEDLVRIILAQKQAAEAAAGAKAEEKIPTKSNLLAALSALSSCVGIGRPLSPGDVTAAHDQIRQVRELVQRLPE